MNAHRDGDERASRPGCLDENLLGGFAEGSLTRLELSHAERHVASCGRCRSRLVFALQGEIEEAPVTVAESQPAIQICVALRDAVGKIEDLFEDCLSMMQLTLQGEPVPIFRGEHTGAISTVRLGPYELSMKRVMASGGSQLHIGVKKGRMPLADTWATFVLRSGDQVKARTDTAGWMQLDAIGIESIATIWINATT